MGYKNKPSAWYRPQIWTCVSGVTHCKFCMLVSGPYKKFQVQDLLPCSPARFRKTDRLLLVILKVWASTLTTTFCIRKACTKSVLIDSSFKLGSFAMICTHYYTTPLVHSVDVVICLRLGAILHPVISRGLFEKLTFSSTLTTDSKWCFASCLYHLQLHVNGLHKSLKKKRRVKVW